MLYIWFKLIIMKKIIFLPFFLLSITCFSQSYESKNDSINYIAKTLNFEKTIGITTINWNLELENGNLFINKSFFEKNKKGNLNLIKKLKKERDERDSHHRQMLEKLQEKSR